MESEIGEIYGQSDAVFRQLPITEFAHKAGVVGDDGVSTLLAALDMPTERRRAAALDGRHHLQLVEANVTGIGRTPRGPVLAEDIRDLQRWTGHGRRRLRRRRVFPAPPGLLARV